MDFEADDAGVFVNEDVCQLKSAWRNEQGSPGLLAYREEVVEGILAQCQNMEENLDEALDEEDSSSEFRFQGNIYRMELDRVRFVLRAYLRCRLFKIQKFATYLLSDEDERAKLSEKELKFAAGFVDAVERSHQKSFTDNLPKFHRSLTEQSRDVNMIPQPKMDAYTFLQVKEDVGLYSLPSSNEELELTADSVHCLPYSDMEQLVEEGKAELV